MKIKQYSGRRIKDGSLVCGYVAQGTECGRAYILVPASRNSVRVIEADPESLEEL